MDIRPAVPDDAVILAGLHGDVPSYLLESPDQIMMAGDFAARILSALDNSTFSIDHWLYRLGFGRAITSESGLWHGVDVSGSWFDMGMKRVR